MDTLVSASFITSFFAGVAALFAPCCITVLLPTYLASIFKQRSTIFFMTFIFFLGILAIFLPLGLGAAFLSQFFSQYHNTIFAIGALFLAFLGLSLLTGQQMAMPFTVHPQLKNFDILSIFILGIFSAIATTCCAPVLAGVLTLSVLPGSVLLGGIYTLAYVLGMVIPLFVLAAVLDKTNLTEKFLKLKKTLNYSLLGQTITLSISSLLAGLMFLILGVFILYLSWTNQLSQHTDYQLTVNLFMANTNKTIGKITGILPEYIWGLLFIGILLYLAKLAFDQLRDSIIQKEGRKK